MPKVIFAKTHAAFLNQVFNTNYKSYMKSRWVYDESTIVWMIRMDGQIRDGWKNRVIDKNEIWEEYVFDDDPSYKESSERRYRIVVNVIDAPLGREYHILGKYKFDFENSTHKKHILIKSEEI